MEPDGDGTIEQVQGGEDRDEKREMKTRWTLPVCGR